VACADDTVQPTPAAAISPIPYPVYTRPNEEVDLTAHDTLFWPIDSRRTYTLIESPLTPLVIIADYPGQPQALDAQLSLHW
jgi:hypothetical protein